MLRFKADGAKRWEIHDHGLATYFFGIWIVQSVDAITINQRPFARASTLGDVFGAGWDKQPPGPDKHVIPLPAGTAYEARLTGETPASPAELRALETKFGYKFRTLLGKFMQLTSPAGLVSTWSQLPPPCLSTNPVLDKLILKLFTR
jgi:hypothetical protein